MKHLSIDVETFSTIDIKAGAYKYAEGMELLLLAYSYDYGPVKCIDLARGEKIPSKLEADIFSPDVIKHAFNANFERVILSKHFGRYCEPEQWRCTQALCALSSLPISLGLAAKSLKMEEDKDAKGKALIKYFSVPCKPTKVNGGRTRNYPEHDLEKWQQFVEYCKQDVVVEQSIEKKLHWINVPEKEQSLWAVDQRINDRGWGIDTEFVNKALHVYAIKSTGNRREADSLTGLENSNSTDQLTKWLTEEKGMEIPNLKKETVAELTASAKDEEVKRVLELRSEMSMSSVKKYEAMNLSVMPDGRLYGLIQFAGASRTGRFAGRLSQPHNYPRLELPQGDLFTARELVSAGEIDVIEALYDSVPFALSQLLRPTHKAAEGKIFRVLDYKSIEARVLVWLAGEDWALEVFRSGGDLYKATASKMYKKPIEKVTKDERQRGKVATLALGYFGGVGALIRSGADKYMSEHEMQATVDAWRAANPRVVDFWKDLEKNAKRTITTGETTRVGKIVFSSKRGALRAKMPSGRYIYYQNAQILPNRKTGRDCIHFKTALNKAWVLSDTYSGKLCENFCQAIARDCLAQALLNLKEAPVVGHVHDEIIVETHPNEWSIDTLSKAMLDMPEWANGLPLDVDGGEHKYYCK